MMVRESEEEEKKKFASENLLCTERDVGMSCLDIVCSKFTSKRKGCVITYMNRGFVFLKS